MNTIDSLGFYDRSHDELKQYKQWRFSTEGAELQKTPLLSNMILRKMQHSFFTNFIQTDTWRKIQLNICISFAIDQLHILN